MNSDKYYDWAGSVNKLDDPKHGVEHKYICGIVAGYYIKIDKSPTKKFAILYPFRPFKSVDGEPEIAVMELDKQENFVKDATVKTVKAENIFEIGGGTNSLCLKVTQWLKENMGAYYNGVDVESGTDDGQVDPACAMEKMLGILDHETLRKMY